MIGRTSEPGEETNRQFLIGLLDVWACGGPNIWGAQKLGGMVRLAQLHGVLYGPGQGDSTTWPPLI